MFFVWFSTRERGGRRGNVFCFVEKRQGRAEEEEDWMQCFLSNPVQVQEQGWWDEDVHVLGLVSYKGIHWRIARMFFVWLDPSWRGNTHPLNRKSCKVQITHLFTTGYKWTLNFLKSGQMIGLHACSLLGWMAGARAANYTLADHSLFSPRISLLSSSASIWKEFFFKKGQKFSKNSALTHLKV